MDNKELRQSQVGMHKDFFDRCKFAIENGFYLEAIILEYAAIESRLESICGILGLPCNKELDPKQRESIKISQRIVCLKKVRNRNKELFEKCKLKDDFFYKSTGLDKWTEVRNNYVHGLYKDVIKYRARNRSMKKDAEDGYEIARLLYNETKRLRRLKNSKPELFENIICTQKKACYLNDKK